MLPARAYSAGERDDASRRHARASVRDAECDSRAPDPLSLVDENGDFGPVDCVISSAWHSSAARRKLESKGFAVVASNEYVKTWARKGAVGSESSADVPGVSTTRKLIALLLELSLLIAVAGFATGCRRGLLRSSVASILVMTAFGCVVMSHPLLEPNGLGVYGGKAKLWFLCGGMPSWFMASSGGAVLKPAYPPGVTELAIPVFVIVLLVHPVSFVNSVADGARRFCRGFMSAAIPAVLLLLAIPYVCGFHDASYSEWMIGNTVPRLVWYLLAIPFAVLFGFVRRF